MKHLEARNSSVRYIFVRGCANRSNSQTRNSAAMFKLTAILLVTPVLLGARCTAAHQLQKHQFSSLRTAHKQRTLQLSALSVKQSPPWVSYVRSLDPCRCLDRNRRRVDHDFHLDMPSLLPPVRRGDGAAKKVRFCVSTATPSMQPHQARCSTRNRAGPGSPSRRSPSARATRFR